jgi:hypothetical protein
MSGFVWTTAGTSGTDSATLTRLEGIAGFLVVLASVLAEIGCFFAVGFASGTLVAVALAAVALVDPVARVEAAFEDDDFNAESVGSTVFVAVFFGAGVFVVVAFDAACTGLPDSGSAFLGRPRRAGALRTLAFN